MEVKKTMTIRYALKAEKPVVEPMEDISVMKMRLLAVEQQIKALNNIGEDITTIMVGNKQFKLRYKNLETGLYTSQKFTPYISKNGRLVVIRSGAEEIEFTEAALKKLQA